jgi:hypothetical protein
MDVPDEMTARKGLEDILAGRRPLLFYQEKGLLSQAKSSITTYVSTILLIIKLFVAQCLSKLSLKIKKCQVIIMGKLCIIPLYGYFQNIFG